MTAGRRIVLVGSEGQVARALMSVLQSGGHHVITLGRPDFDLAEPGTLATAITAARPEIVINPAAYTAVDKAEDEAARAFAINADGAGAVAAAAAAAGAPLIHFSTDYVFDGAKTTPYLETDATGPAGVYGASKLEGERRVAAANPRHIILRTAWVCSPAGANFVKTMLRLAAERPELRVVDDQRGNPTFAHDLAHAVSQLIPRLARQDTEPEAFGVFHAVNSGATTWCGFARAIMRGSSERGGPHVPIRAIATSDYPTRASRPAHSMLSTTKLDAVHGIRLQPWETALANCLDDLIGPIRVSAAG